MKSSLKNYKDYPAPLRIFLAYILITAVGMRLIDLLAAWWSPMMEGFLDFLISIPLALVFVALGGLVFGYFLSLFCCLGKKTYRGIGLYRIVRTVCVSSFILFIAMIVFIKKTQTPYNFFDVFCLFLQFAFPAYMFLFLHFSVERCTDCGLIKTFQHAGESTQTLGTRDKYRTEGGYYQDVKTKGTVAGDYVEVTTQQYVPKTKVYEGKYETTRTTSRKRCNVCGNIKISTWNSERKIGG